MESDRQYEMSAEVRDVLGLADRIHERHLGKDVRSGTYVLSNGNDGNTPAIYFRYRTGLLEANDDTHSLVIEYPSLDPGHKSYYMALKSNATNEQLFDTNIGVQLYGRTSPYGLKADTEANEQLGLLLPRLTPDAPPIIDPMPLKNLLAIRKRFAENLALPDDSTDISITDQAALLRDTVERLATQERDRASRWGNAEQKIIYELATHEHQHHGSTLTFAEISEYIGMNNVPILEKKEIVFKSDGTEPVYYETEEIPTELIFILSAKDPAAAKEAARQHPIKAKKAEEIRRRKPKATPEQMGWAVRELQMLAA